MRGRKPLWPAIVGLVLLCAAPAGPADARPWRPARVVRHGVLLDRHGLIDRPLLREALRSLRAHRDQVASWRRIAVVDLSRPSGEPRFYVLNLHDGSVRLMVTTHGRGSDPDQTGRVARVSNALGSQASSTGAYLTGVAYDSPAHLSRAVRLDGLDPTDSNARCRCLVIHEANRSDGRNYASREWIAAHVGADGLGQAGRSDGCFAFSREDYPYVLRRMVPGVFLYAGPVSLPQWTPEPAAASAGCCPQGPGAGTLPGAPSSGGEAQ